MIPLSDTLLILSLSISDALAENETAINQERIHGRLLTDTMSMSIDS